MEERSVKTERSPVQFRNLLNSCHGREKFFDILERKDKYC